MKQTNLTKPRYKEGHTREKVNNCRIDKKTDHNYFQHMYDKHKHQARDALLAGDKILAEYHYQHAEHFFRSEKADEEKQSPVNELSFQGGKDESRTVYAKNAKRYPGRSNVSVKRKEPTIFPTSLCESTVG